MYDTDEVFKMNWRGGGEGEGGSWQSSVKAYCHWIPFVQRTRAPTGTSFRCTQVDSVGRGTSFCVCVVVCACVSIVR